MTVVLLGSASHVPPPPHRASSLLASSAQDTSGVRDGEAEPNKAMGRDLGRAFARAHRGWAARYAPHLLEEWLDA